MKADSFSKLMVLQALIDAEVGFYLEQPASSIDAMREGLIARISDLIDEIDALDAVAAARTYDAIVDFLAELPEAGKSGVVDAAIRLRRAVDRIVDLGLDRRARRDASTWAVVLDELLAELRREYAASASGSLAAAARGRARARSLTLLVRAREATDHLLFTGQAVRRDSELSSLLDRLMFAVRHEQLEVAEVEALVRAAQRRVARYRPTTLTRVGGFVLRQVLRRDRRRRPERMRGRERAGPDDVAPGAASFG